MENITEEIIEFMREKLIREGKSGGGFAAIRNLVQYMEAEEVCETYKYYYPDKQVIACEI